MSKRRVRKPRKDSPFSFKLDAWYDPPLPYWSVQYVAYDQERPVCLTYVQCFDLWVGTDDVVQMLHQAIAMYRKDGYKLADQGNVLVRWFD